MFLMTLLHLSFRLSIGFHLKRGRKSERAFMTVNGSTNLSENDSLIVYNFSAPSADAISNTNP
jgi:hypothetical protein